VDFRIWWPLEGGLGNLCDVLTPRLLEAYGYVPHRVPRDEADWFFIGSTIRFARPATTVVGAGVIDRRDRIDPRARYLAVRGPITAEIVRKAGGEPPEVQGDPAMLLPRFYHPPVQPTVPVGLVPHYVDRHDPQVAAWRGVVIDVLRNNPLKVIDDIRKCEAVISSSLHGIIIAHAYGIPAAWVRLGGRLWGDDVKFDDYAASVGVELKPYSSVTGAVPILPAKIDTSALHELLLSLRNHQNCTSLLARATARLRKFFMPDVPFPVRAEPHRAHHEASLVPSLLA
jgi:hypothetical protein